MNENRIFGILLTDLTSDKLKLEEELERLLNNNINTIKKVKLIKKLLSKINKNEMMTLKIKHYMGVGSETKQLLNEIKNKKK